MPTLKFPQFLRRFNLTLLPVATDDIIPGAVLAKRRGYIYHGHLSEILTAQPKKFWRVETNAANIVYGSIERSVSLKGKSSLDHMGVSIEGGLARARSMTFSISAVHARTFKNGPGYASMFALIPLLQALKKKNRAAWRLVNDKRIVLETYYATEASVSFETSGNVDLAANVDAAGGVSVHGGGRVRWTGKRSFKITKNQTVPFAFRGWRV